MPKSKVYEIKLILTYLKEGGTAIIWDGQDRFVSDASDAEDFDLGVKVHVKQNGSEESIIIKFLFDLKREEELEWSIAGNMRMIHYDTEDWSLKVSAQKWSHRMNDFLTPYKNGNWSLYDVHLERLPQRFKSIFKDSMSYVYDVNKRNKFIQKCGSLWMKKHKMTPEQNARAGRKATQEHVFRSMARALTGFGV